MRCIWTIGFLLCSQLGLSQQNLVPNPSFEIIDFCPNSAGGIVEAPPWRKVGGGGGVPIYHECGWNGFGMPINWSGTQHPRTGLSYSNIINWIAPYEDLILEGNFIGVPLDSSLKEGHKYSVEYYINLADSMLYATRNIGAYFSVIQPTDDIEVLLGLEPQVQYTDSAYLSNKEDWMRISGDFIAEGGESFLTIGNFDGHHESDTLYIGNGGPPYPLGNYYWEATYYYLDDVSVVEDTSYHVGVDGQLTMDNGQLSIYPNPASDIIRVRAHGSGFRKSHIRFTDAFGRTVWNYELPPVNYELEVSSWPPGVYHYSVVVDGTVTHSGKQVIIR